MRTTSDKHRTVLRYVYALVGIVSFTAVALGLSILARNAVLEESRSRVEQYHVRSLMLAREAAVEVSRIELALAAREPSQPGTRGTTGARAVELGVAALGHSLGALQTLQDAFADRRFSATVERAARQRGELARLSSAEPPDRTAQARQANALGLSLFQLDRLHSVTLESTLAELAATRERWTLQLALLITAVLLLGSLVTVRLLRLLRTRLAEHELAEAGLLEHERRLQHASKLEAVGTLVGGVAHDFNNMLTAVMGHAQLLLDRPAGAERVEHSAGEILKAAERASELTRRLLMFSRRDVAEPKIIDANLLVCETEEVLRRLIPETIALQVEYADEVLPIEVDLAQMQQVLLNLAVNARDAMPDGGRLVIGVSRIASSAEVAALQTSRPGAYVRIRVSDDGCGMTPEVLARSFEPFFTTKQREHGTGLGLATAHGLVTGSGGAIDVSSEVGVGTTFELFLPLSELPLTRLEAPTRAPAAIQGSETILLAEDEQQVRELVAAGLRDAGYEVLAGSDGPEALQLCLEHGGPIDLVLTDVVMPCWRGPELVRRVRARQPDVGVLYLSGYTQDEVLEDASGQAATLVTKPVSIPELLQAVRRQLDRSARGRPEPGLTT